MQCEDFVDLACFLPCLETIVQGLSKFAQGQQTFICEFISP
jgi:hypothetical protein